MRKLLFLLSIVLCSCGLVDPSADFYSLKYPIVVAGTNNKSVLVVDADNKYLLIKSGYYLAESLSKYKIGDTIIYQHK